MTALNIKFRRLIARRGEEYDSGCLIVQNGMIKEIIAGPLESFAGETLDLSDCLVLPGFVNLHCHLSLSALKGKVPLSESMTGWIRSVVEEDAALALSDRIKAMRCGAETLIRTGVTTLADYLPISNPGLMEEYASLPFRQALFLEVLGFRGEQSPAITEKIKAFLAEHDPQSGLIKLGLAPHAPYSVSPALFRETRKIADQMDMPYSCHTAEFAEEARFIREGGGDMESFLRDRGAFDETWKPPGKSPARYLDSLGVLDSMLAIHLNHAQDDMDLLAARGVAAAFCPGSARWFGRQQWTPVRQMLDRGMKVGLGTDSLASNESLNFLRELRLAEEMLPGVSREEILEMATTSGASALGLKTGILAPGCPADLIALRTPHPPANWSDLPFDPKRNEVDLTMVEGKIVFHN